MIEGLLWVVFTLLCLAVSGLVLLQEGKGGGLGDAFGGAGAQTFGVKAQGVAKVTGYMAAGIVVVAIVITKMRSGQSGGEEFFDDEVPPAGAIQEPGASPVPGGDAGEGSTDGDG